MTTPTVEAVFKKIGKIGEGLRDGIKAIDHCDIYTVTKNANIFYYIKKEGKLGLYSL